jgi:phage terminase large subunit-like protein
MHPWRKKIVDFEPVDNLIELGNSLCQPDGMKSGQPLVMADFQKLIAEAFGKDINGDRVVNRILITVPRKSGKTALIAIFLIYLLVVEPIPYAQHYSIAFDRDQAAIVFHYARNIINMSPELSGVISITESKKLLTNVVNGSTYQALSSEGRSKHGKSSRVVIIDELHAFGVNDDLLSIMETSTGAYGKEALVIIIGTQSPDDNSVMSQWVDYANGVNDGSIKDDSFAGFVWAAPEDADIWDEKVWYDCNPGMQAGFRSIDEMRQTAERAKELGGAKVAQFRNLYLNQRIDASNPFISKEAWLANDKPVDMEIFKTNQCYGGLDLSRRGDLTAFVLACVDDDNDLHILVWCWTPYNLLKQHQLSDKAPYIQWAEDGFLETTPGNSIGYDWVANKLSEINSEYNIVNINYDRYKIEELQRELDREGVTLPLEPLGQGYKDFSPCMDDLEHCIAEHILHHDKHPVLTWAISNTVVDEDPAGNRKMNKQKSFGRIDPAVALAMAIRGAMVNVVEQGISDGDEGIMFV